MTVRSILVNVAANVGPYVGPMNTAGAATGRFAAQTAAMQTGVRGAAGSLKTMGAEAGLLNPKLLGAAGLVYGIKSVSGAAVSWESAFAGVRKTVDGTETELQGLSDGLRRMSTDIPTSAVELAGIAEAAGQLGIQTDNVESFTRVIADLGETTNLTGQEGATQLARLANITQMSQDDFDRLGSTVVDLGNNLATTESEIVNMGLRIAGAGAQVGMTEADILGIAGALSSVGIEAEAGGSAISRVMMDIASEVETGGDKLGDFAAVAGMSASEFSAAWREDAAGALATFITGLGQMDEQGGSTLQTLEDLGITEIRMRDALLRSAGAGDLLTDALEMGNDAWRENNALQQEAAQRYETTEAKMQTARNALTDLRVEMGERLLPAIGDVSTAFTDLLRFELPGTSDGGPSNANIGQMLSDGLIGGLGASFGLSGLFGGGGVDREVERQAAADAASAHTDAEQSIRREIDALNDLPDASDTAADGLSEAERAQDRLEQATRDALSAFRDQTDAFTAMTDPLFGAITAWLDYQEALADLDAVQADAEASADDLAEAERNVYDSAGRARAGLAGLVDENGDLVYSTDEVIRRLAEMKVPPEVIQRLLADIGLVDGALGGLTGQPHTVMVHVRVDRAELDALRAEFGYVATGRPGEGGRTHGTGTTTQDTYVTSPTPSAHWDSIPRNHSGGIITGTAGWAPGLASDERLRVLQLGETVVPAGPAPARAMAAAGGAPGMLVAEGAVQVYTTDARAGITAVRELRDLQRQVA